MGEGYFDPVANADLRVHKEPGGLFLGDVTIQQQNYNIDAMFLYFMSAIVEEVKFISYSGGTAHENI